ncbi:MAG: hypothetical protein K1X79_14370 [Oligoflexia bacterium]|nr:hypothetical protein [Oligoflexia bacterium]
MSEVFSRVQAWSQRVAISVLLSPVLGFCDGHACSLAAESAGGVLVNIRTVRALDKIDEKINETTKATLSVDGRLRDLSAKLQKLHFRTFKLIASQREVLRFGHKETVALSDGNLVTLRPLSMENEKIGLWVRWQDGSGMEVIDTRMHFAPGESIITGVDASGDTGLILAIDVNPFSQKSPPIAEPVTSK